MPTHQIQVALHAVQARPAISWRQIAGLLDRHSVRACTNLTICFGQTCTAASCLRRMTTPTPTRGSSGYSLDRCCTGGAVWPAAAREDVRKVRSLDAELIPALLSTSAGVWLDRANGPWSCQKLRTGNRPGRSCIPAIRAARADANIAQAVTVLRPYLMLLHRLTTPDWPEKE